MASVAVLSLGFAFSLTDGIETAPFTSWRFLSRLRWRVGERILVCIGLRVAVVNVQSMSS